MITFLKGTLEDALPTKVVVEVNGVGYELLIPLSSFEKLPSIGQAVIPKRNWLLGRTLRLYMVLLLKMSGICLR